MATITLTPETFDEFCEHCLDPNRADPFIAVATERENPNSLRFPMERIDHCLKGEDVLIYVVPPTMFERLNAFENGRYAVYDGALRIVGLGGGDDDLMLGRTSRDRDDAFRHLAQRFHQSAARLRSARGVNDVGAPTSNVVWSSDASKPTACTACHCADCLADERALHERIERLERQVQGLGRRLTATTSRTAAKTSTTLASVPSLPVVYTDPEQQARYEIEQTWLTRYDEERRGEFPLREYEFGPAFVASLTDRTFTAATHAQMLSACVDVVTGAVYDIPARHAHPASDAGQPTPVRDDGATVYRATVNVGPGATRIIWWRRPDGTVELMKITHHDDYRLD